MRFDELMLQVPEDELRLRFHARMTVLAGLSAAERREMIDGILSALSGGPQAPTATALRYTDGNGDPATVVGREGRISVRRDDGTPLPEPVGTIVPNAAALRQLMVIEASAVGGATARRDDEPDDLREARDTLEELTAELDAALAEQAELADARQELKALEGQLVAARNGAARREYALLLAEIERVRAEAAAVDADAEGVEADHELLANVDSVTALAGRWQEAVAEVERLEALCGDAPDIADREELVEVPAQPPEALPLLVDRLEQAARRRHEIDQRLQDLAVASLPAPSDPLVARLGLADQDRLWAAARALVEARATVRDVQLSLGGLELESAPTPEAVSTIEAIEAAHRDLEEADRAAEKAKVAGLAGAGAGVVGALVGLAAAPVLAPVGLVGAAAAAGAGLVRPRAKKARAEKAEAQALAEADAPTYLAFHLRRVEASVDPKLRSRVDSARATLQAAESAWIEVAGSEAGGAAPDVEHALTLEAEIRAYNAAVADLGETADEMEHLRAELTERVEPEWRAARADVVEASAPYLVPDERIDEPGLLALVAHQCRLGAAARSALELSDATTTRDKLAGQLSDALLQLGFDAGELPARIGALEWAAGRAAEREAARRRARPRAEIEAELRDLEDQAAAIRQPEWADVTAAEAELPDIPTLEARQAELTALLDQARSDVDIERLADRQAAVSRRVASLEARYGGAANRDPSALSEMQSRLIARLTAAAHAGPQGDPVPVLLDEALAHVPPDRVWDQLDMLHRMAESHQVVYLTDDAFVAAWARQKATEGSVTLLAPEHEPV